MQRRVNYTLIEQYVIDTSYNLEIIKIIKTSSTVDFLSLTVDIKKNH